MVISQLLANYLNKEIEVFFDNDFLHGNLITVSNTFFTVRVPTPSYTDPFEIVNVILDSVNYVRVINP